MSEVSGAPTSLEVYHVRARKGKVRERPGVFMSRCLAQSLYNGQKRDEQTFIWVSRDHVGCGTAEETDEGNFKQLMSCVGCSAIAMVERDAEWNIVRVSEPPEDGEHNLYFSNYTDNRLSDCPEVTFRIESATET